MQSFGKIDEQSTRYSKTDQGPRRDNGLTTNGRTDGKGRKLRTPSGKLGGHKSFSKMSTIIDINMPARKLLSKGRNQVLRPWTWITPKIITKIKA